jgi:hypothetical protein
LVDVARKEGDEKKMFPVRGYYRPESSFHIIKEWELISKKFIELESQGYDVRGGEISDNNQLLELVNKYFGYQLYTETELYPQLTKKMVLDFIEDFQQALSKHFFSLSNSIFLVKVNNHFCLLIL